LICRKGEAEIVAGYNVEYSSITFALFFLGEYGNMLVLAFIITLFYLGG
jgi:NADH-quinone oxidoreductase subunit H